MVDGGRPNNQSDGCAERDGWEQVLLALALLTMTRATTDVRAIILPQKSGLLTGEKTGRVVGRRDGCKGERRLCKTFLAVVDANVGRRGAEVEGEESRRKS